MSFADLTVRANATKIYASWFNDIRTKLISYFGAGLVAETQFTIADNQAAYANITGLLFDHLVVRSVKVEYSIYRTNGSSTERREMGTVTLTYKPVAGTWAIARVTDTDDDALNVTDSLYVVPATGQMQYKSDSVGGTYVGKMRYKVLTSFDKET
jgi:hypothetical protein